MLKATECFGVPSQRGLARISATGGVSGTTLTFTSVITDNYSMLSGDTSTIVIPFSGPFLINVQIAGTASGGSGNYGLSIVKNGSALISGNFFVPSTDPYTVTLPWLQDFVRGDKITFTTLGGTVNAGYVSIIQLPWAA